MTTDGPKNTAGFFATTHWSVVLAAGADSVGTRTQALEALCRAYWYPLYAFLRRCGHNQEDASDWVQGFFAQILANDFLKTVARECGKFRSLLLSSLKYYVADQRARGARLKRGGGQPLLSLDAGEAETRYALEPANDLSPDKLFDRRWAWTLIDRALARIEAEFSAAGKQATFKELRHVLPGGTDHSSAAEVALRLGTTEGAVKVAVHRLRGRFRQVLREEVVATVASAADVDEEIQHLIAAVGS